MSYKYNRFQIFRKKLNVPKEVQKRIYQKKATPEDFLSYNLVDKIPINCLDNKYKSIIEIVGIKKGLELDWECVLSIKPEYTTELEEWFQKNTTPEQSSEELNNLLYTSIKDEYLDMLKRNAPYDAKLIKEVKTYDNQFRLEKLGKKFAKVHPELLYIKDFFMSKDFLLKQLNLGEYFYDYDQYQNIPISYIKNALKSEADKEIFEFLSPLVKNSEDVKRERTLLIPVFYQRSIYETEQYLPLLEELPDIDTFLRNAYLQRLKKQYWLRPGESSIYEYNIGRENKFMFGEKINEEILKLADQNPEYEIILSQLLKTKITKDNNITIEEFVYRVITEDNCSYGEELPDSFKEKYPELFLPKEVSASIKEKFYERDLTPNDFIENPNLLSYFNHLDIASYLKDYEWLITNEEEIKLENATKLKIATMHYNLSYLFLKNTFQELILKNIESESLDKIELLEDMITLISYSNSEEIVRSGKELVVQILQVDNCYDNLQKIETMFLKNNIPYVGKSFYVFQTLHPDFLGFDLSKDSKASPILQNKSNRAREVIIFSDLLKASFGSNNRSVKEYLKNIEEGYELLKKIDTKNISINQLSTPERKKVSIFIEHLETLYNNTVSGKSNEIKKSDNLEANIHQMLELFSEDGNVEYDLPDRIVKMFCHFAGFDTCRQIKDYMKECVLYADFKNRVISQKEMELEVEDFLKGIGDIKYLKNILQNGSVAKEFLGASSQSDSTPLDTDVSRILEKGKTIQETIAKTISRTYGPIWIVLKNNDRFIITREDEEEAHQKTNIKPDLSKLEAFQTLQRGHYGIRTGFASTEIDYFIIEEKDPRVGLEIAMNGFYIPVIDKTGKLIFSPQDYDEIRAKMQGLKYYDQEGYEFSNTILSPRIEKISATLQNNNYEVEKKRTAIQSTISKSIENLGLTLKIEIDGDLTNGSIEIIDTGSTGRGTNIPGSGDFDFIMRLDKKIISNPKELKKVKDALLKGLHATKTEDMEDFRLKDVLIEGIDNPLEIDITFIPKTDKISYSTDMSIRDRLETIKEQSEEMHSYVLANIILAKQVLKDANVYKPNRGAVPQGGLGGVGIENWILQNGGSFVEAAISFLNASEGKSFQEFKENYAIWDFGENHLSSRKGIYPHDNFVNNMSEKGYHKMNKALKNYVNSLGNVEYQEGRKLH